MSLLRTSTNFTFDRLNQKRVTKDINELQLPSTCKTEFEDPDDLLNFQLIICPDEGFYRGGRFVFNFKVGNNYPHEPPKVNIAKNQDRGSKIFSVRLNLVVRIDSKNIDIFLGKM